MLSPLLLALPALAAPLSKAAVTAELERYAATQQAGIELHLSGATWQAEGTWLKADADGTRVELGLSRSVTLGLSAAELTPLLSFTTLPELNTGLELEGWALGTYTPQSSLRSGVTLSDVEGDVGGEGGLRVDFEWSLYAVDAVKQSPSCLEAMNGSEAAPPPECYVLVEVRAPLRLSVEGPIVYAPGTPAPDTRAYPEALTERAREALPCGESCWATRMHADAEATWVVGGELIGGASTGWVWRRPAQGDPLRVSLPEVGPLSAVVAVDGGAILAGTQGRLGDRVGYALRVDAQGEVLWSQRFEGEAREEGALSKPGDDDGVNELRLLPDGDVLLVGARLRRLDAATGALRWEKPLGTLENSGAASALLPSGDVVVVGDCKARSGEVKMHGVVDFLVTRVDSEGEALWTRCLGGRRIDEANAVTVLESGNLLVAGSTNSIDGDVVGMEGDNRLWVVELTPEGELVGQQLLGSSRVVDVSPSQPVAALLPRSGGALVLATNRGEDIEVEVRGGTDGLIMQLDSTQTLAWQQSIGSPQRDALRDARLDGEELVVLLYDGAAKESVLLRYAVCGEVEADGAVDDGAVDDGAEAAAASATDEAPKRRGRRWR